MNNSIQLSGLSRQLVQANLLDEKTAVQAQAQAQRNKLSLVTHLVQNKLVSGLALAELSAEQFGIAYCDLNSLDKESFPRDAISEAGPPTPGHPSVAARQQALRRHLRPRQPPGHQ